MMMTEFLIQKKSWITAYLLSLALVIGGLEILSGTLQDWNGRRLITPIGLLFGQDVFSRVGEGATISGRNAPLSTLAYVPAGLASDPVTAIRFGVLISLILAFGGSLFALRSGLVRNKQELSLGLLFGIFFLMVQASPALRISYFIIHADAPAIGLALFFLFFSLRYVHTEQKSDLIIALIFGCGSALSKITFHPILIGLIFYIWINLGFKAALKCAIQMVIIYSVFTLLLAGLVGFRNYSDIFLHLTFKSPWLVPGAGIAHTLPDRIWALVLGLRDFCLSHLVHLGALFLLIHFKFKKHKSEAFFWKQQFKSNWFFCMILALVMLPGGLMARAKAGGVENSWSTFVVFMALGIIFLVREQVDLRNQKQAKIFLTLVLLLSLVGLRKVRSLLIFYPTIKDSGTHQSYSFAKEHPGKVYFPEYPLTTLYTDRKVYHSGAALGEFLFIGIPFESAVIRRHLPQNIEWVVQKGPTESPPVFLPEFTKKEMIPSLPGWEAWKRDG